MAEIVSMPKLGFDMAEGTLVRWVIAEGEKVAKGAILAEIETDKATVEVESNYDGVLARQLVGEGEVVPVNTPIAVVGAPDEKIDYTTILGESAPPAPAAPGADEAGQAPAEAAAAPEAAPAREGEGDGRLPADVRASPLARRMAEEHAINLQVVTGTGPRGRIVKEDVESYLKKQAEGTPLPPSREAPEAATAPRFTPLGPPPPDERIPLNRLRAAIGRRMKAARQEVPHFYVTYEYDMAALMQLRQQVNQMLPENEKTSVNDYLIKAVALTLREYPNLNAVLDGDAIIQRGQVNIGVAVAVEGGLLTVVCRDTDRKSIRQISGEVRTMVGRAREGKVRPEDIEGSTFSVSNLGMYGVDDFTAIINPPEAAILAVAAVREVPVVKDGEVVPGLRMKATISVDHRISDGAEAARFLRALEQYIHEPLRLML